MGEDYVGDLPASVQAPRRAESHFLFGDDGRALLLLGFLPWMVFAGVARGSWGARDAWLQSLDGDRVSRGFRCFEPACPSVQDPPERRSIGSEHMASQRGSDLARDSLDYPPYDSPLV